MRKNKINIPIMGILFLIFALGIGYAYLNTTLNISGATSVEGNTWDIHWENIQVNTESVAAEEPEIDEGLTNVSFEIHLEKPGDFYEFTVDAVNAGTVDGMIESFSATINGSEEVPNYLDYDVRYDDGMLIENKFLLEANKSERYRIKIEYKEDINSSDLPSTDQALNAHFEVVYVQADTTAVRRYGWLYTSTSSSSTIFYIGEEMPSNVTTYRSTDDALGNYEHLFFLSHWISKTGIIKESYVGFKYNDNIYYIQGGDNGQAYDNNVAVMTEAFGEENCSTVINLSLIMSYWSCSGNGLRIGAFPNGRVFAQKGNERICYVREDKSSYCYKP